MRKVGRMVTTLSIPIEEGELDALISAAISGKREIKKRTILKLYVAMLHHAVETVKFNETGAGAVKKTLRDAIYEVEFKLNDNLTWSHSKKNRDGENEEVSVHISDMDDQHLTNSIDYMERKAVKVVLSGQGGIQNRGYQNSQQYLGITSYPLLILEAHHRGVLQDPSKLKDYQDYYESLGLEELVSG
jgi:hypothetical protein